MTISLVPATPLRLVVFTLAVLAFSATSSAQKPADFSGTWVPVAGGAQMWKIEQSATILTLRVSVRDRETSVTSWTFDGVPTNSPTYGIGGTPSTTTASLAGNQLRIVGTVTLKNGTGALDESWTLDPSGNSFKVLKVVESRRARR